MLSNAFRRGLWPLVITFLAVHARAAERPVVGLDRYYNHATRDAKPCRYAWEDTSDGGYSELARLIQGLGAETVSVDQPASKQSLAGLDVYLVVAPNAPEKVEQPRAIAPEAVDAIAQWVRDGGVLVLLGNSKGYADSTLMNRIAERFGIRFNDDTRFGAGCDPAKCQMREFPDHPFFVGVKKLHMRSVCTLSVRPPAEVVYRFQDDDLMAVGVHGKGTVFALGDPWGYNEYIDAFDNRVGLANVFRWLLAKSTNGEE